MKISEVIKGIEILRNNFNPQIEISGLAYDSRKVKEGNAFVCLCGAEFDGHNFIEDAIKRGANTIVVQKECHIDGVNIIFVENTRKALATMSKNFFNNPASKLKTIGITGTKGKTTTSCMIKSILETAGSKVGLIGTLGVDIEGKITATNNTTPESYEVQKYLSDMVKSGCEYAVLEVSSIGLREHRLDGVFFDYGIFTNLSEDHIGGNEHKDMDEYVECKSKLFKKCKVGIINIDDKNVDKVIKNHICSIKTFGFSKKAEIRADDAKLLRKPGYLGSGFKVYGELEFEAKIPIPGKFNIYNALAAISVCNYLGIKVDSIKKGLDLAKVKGRVELVKVPGEYTLLIDYAHNAASMENVLKTLKEYRPKRLITMFGAGGNRPKIRRYEMGEAAGKLSDFSVVTEDNSRNENVMDIIADIEVGLKKTNGKYVIIPNRKAAIRYCIENAKEGDIIVLAGKGHETYQEINGVKHPFDERLVIKEIIGDRL